MDSARLLTTREAAGLLGVPERTLRYRLGRAQRQQRSDAVRVGKAWAAPLSWWRSLASEELRPGRPVSKGVDGFRGGGA